MSEPLLLALYARLLRLYPADFRQEYGDEMQAIFALELLENNPEQAWRLAMRELGSAPPVLLRLHGRRMVKRLSTPQWIGAAEGVFELPGRDGRHSWGLAGLETLFFLLWAALLVLLTYVNPDLAPAGWYRNASILGILAVLAPLPFLLLGLLRGLPRWAYPLYGLLVAYLVSSAGRYHLLPLLAASLAAALALLVWAYLAHRQRALSPALTRLGGSLVFDPLRLSFAAYGAAPLLVLQAFDDGRLNDRGPYLALAALGMLMGALLYTRLKGSGPRMGALLAGLCSALLAAALDGTTGNAAAAPAEAARLLGLLGWTAGLVLLPVCLLAHPGRLNKGNSS